MSQRPTGPACGNNPNFPLSDGDRQAVEDFKAYLTARAALRDRIAAVLLPHASLGGTPPRWELPHFDGATPSLPRIAGWKPLDDVADALAAVLSAPTDRAAVERVRAVLETEAVVGRSALEYRGLIASALRADEPQPAQPDTFAAWLYQRFMPDGTGWDNLGDDQRSYWEHQARAVRRAVARGGFKQPTEAWDARDARPGTTDHTLTQRPAAEAQQDGAQR